jgi:hypothetical protein
MAEMIDTKFAFVVLKDERVHVSTFQRPIVAEVGVDQPVIIDKMFGPLIFAKLRVTAHFETCEWIVERQRIDSCEWVEVARIPGQFDHEYDETHPDHSEPPTR